MTLIFLLKIIVRPIEKDLKAEEKFKIALLEAQQENNVKAIVELTSSYSNTPPTVMPLYNCLFKKKTID